MSQAINHCLNKAFFPGARTAHGSSGDWDTWFGQLSWFGLWQRCLSFSGVQGSKLQLILTLGALFTLLFPFDALWEFFGDKDVFKKVQMIVLRTEKERPFEQNLDVIKWWVCSEMFRFYRPLLFINFLQKITSIVYLKLEILNSSSPLGAVIFIIQLLIIQDFSEMQILCNGRRDCIKFFWTVPNTHLET